MARVAYGGPGQYRQSGSFIAPSADRAPDQVLHHTNAGNTTFVVTGATKEVPLNIRNLAIDGDGNVWFQELDGAQAGVIADNVLTMIGYPAAPPRRRSWPPVQ